MSNSSFYSNTGITSADVSSITSAKEAAATSETNAATSATEAANSATQAATSATNAASSETNVSNSAATATTSAANASTSETNASASAATATTQASNAATSATAAAGSASTAGTSATNAASSATNAATSETNAATSETNAANSATSAATSATNAGTSETNAAASASSASGYVTSATTQANNAATSATAAATSETNAASSATAASTSASGASTSASNANTSATNAASSASQAASSAAAAALAADNFDDTYLGSNASDPTTDNDGDALNAGDLHFNTSSNTLKVYNGSAWQDAAIDSSGFVQTTGDTMTGALDVQSTITADGLTVSTLNPEIEITNTGQRAYSLNVTGTSFYLKDKSDAQNIIKVDEGGDISFYEDTGTTPKFFWDASAERLAVGGTTTNATLHVHGNSVISNGNFFSIQSTSGLSPELDEASNGWAFTTSGSERMRIDSSGNVGIGTSSPDNNSGYTALTMSNTSGSGGGQVYVKASSAVGVFGADNASSGANAKVILQTNTSHPLVFGTSGTERMRIDSSGNVGIGTSSPIDYYSDNLVVSAPTENGITIAAQATSNTNYLMFADGTSGDARYRGYIGYLHSTDAFAFGTSGTEAMRIDSSGNLLVGTTTMNGEGITLNASNYLYAKRSGAAAGLFDRNTNDGDIVEFRKSGTTVGSIGTSGGDLTIGTGDTGLKFFDGGDSIFPVDQSTGNNRDNAVDIGYSSVRFKDLYLSGSIEIENGTANVGVGKQALNSNTGTRNTAVGYQAGYALTTGSANVAIGDHALDAAIAADNNVAVGTFALSSTTGIWNTAVGAGAGDSITTGTRNTILGRYNGNQGGLDIRTLSNNIVLSDGDGNPHWKYISSYRSGQGGWSSTSAEPDMTGVNSAGNFGTHLGADGFHEFKRNSALVARFGIQGATGTIIEFKQNGSTRGSISTNGSTTSYNTTSDYRLKENVVELTAATTRLKQLEPKRFNFFNNPDLTVDGFLAHEVQAVVPEAITGTKDEVDDDGNPVYQGIDQGKLVPLLVATIKELEARITALENA